MLIFEIYLIHYNTIYVILYADSYIIIGLISGESKNDYYE